MSPAILSPASTNPVPFRQSIEGATAVAIGSHGLSQREMDDWLGRMETGLARLQDDYATGRVPLLRVADETADVADAAAALDKLSVGARTIVFLGTGGSSLGGQTLAQFSGWNIPGTAEASQRTRPRTRFYDNLDPMSLERVIASLDLPTTRFVVTSKSGNTPETLVQTLAALQAVGSTGLGAHIPKLFLGLTEPAVAGKSNGLRAICEAHGIPLLDHHAGIGGRYSVLTNVGLLPALARGLDVKALRAGASGVITALHAARAPADFPAAVGAALNVALAKERGIRIQVMMPYTDRLGAFTHWFVQLWAESLGKSGQGTTPLACRGPLDQHSQLQLFMDGPREHLITFIRLQTAGTGPRIDGSLASAAGIGEMAGKTVGDLIAAQSHGVPAALTRAGRPLRIFDLDTLDERALGALLMHFMLETILAGYLLGIDPFDQPAVELGKQLARERLRAG